LLIRFEIGFLFLLLSQKP